jgi:hypothetical protein
VEVSLRAAAEYAAMPSGSFLGAVLGVALELSSVRQLNVHKLVRLTRDLGDSKGGEDPLKATVQYLMERYARSLPRSDAAKVVLSFFEHLDQADRSIVMAMIARLQ